MSDAINVNVADDEISITLPDGNKVLIQLQVGRGTLKLNIVDALRAVAYYLNSEVTTTFFKQGRRLN